MISVADLIAMGVGPTLAKTFAQPFDAACTRWGIDTPMRVAAFFAQCFHETEGFQHLEENLYYSSPDRIRMIFPAHVAGPEDAIKLAKNPQALANRVYANRMGNGDEASGDGWRFRGSGLMQITGREEHTKAAAAFVVPMEVFTDLMRSSVARACGSAGWFWTDHHQLNGLADKQDIDAISRVINGGGNGLAERRETYRIALAHLTDSPRAAVAAPSAAVTV